jgi:two-component system phosphate regulon sensor histidine kinase PhoR
MRAAHLFGVACAIGAVPVAALLLLALVGAAAAGAALFAAAVIAAASFGLALLWARDVEVLAEAARLAAAGKIITPAISPAIAPLGQLEREIERIGRARAEDVAQLARQRAADDGVVERLPDPLILIGADRALRRANAAARHTYGGDLASVLRHPVLIAAIDRALAAPRPDPADDAPAPPTVADLNLPVPVARDVQATVIRLAAPLSDGAQAMVVLSDRTRERAVERTRADFVANASHELRTPLASLIGFIDTLRGPAADDPPAQQRFLGIMAEQAARMNRLIDDLLSLSRIELTEHLVPDGRVDLAALLPRVAAGFEPRMKARPMTLAIEIAPELPAVAGDKDQIAQVVQNLLDNALKYGRQGGRTVLTAAPAAMGGRWPSRPGVVVAIADDGQGIAREHLPRLTERFYRVDSGRSRAVGGTGLGLAIVKHIVNRHRGVMAIDSEEGSGTTVHVWLPQGGTERPRIRARLAVPQG